MCCWQPASCPFREQSTGFYSLAQYTLRPPFQHCIAKPSPKNKRSICIIFKTLCRINMKCHILHILQNAQCAEYIIDSRIILHIYAPRRAPARRCPAVRRTGPGAQPRAFPPGQAGSSGRGRGRVAAGRRGFEFKMLVDRTRIGSSPRAPRPPDEDWSRATRTDSGPRKT
jgi:hypothetical protein